ncbi:hypothetical protein [Nitrososphaera sp.]|uniref:hypothetical protein n=1 Tax=Nitrososphaera sp. TaxID=1971748 RepID=UPI00307D915B
MLLVATPALAYAHGGMQPPAADLGGKKASLFLKLDPPVVTDSKQPIFITARFFDENTNQNFKEVTYRIFFKKDGKEIPISTEGGMFGGQGFFYDPNGNLVIKVTPKSSNTAVAKGEPEYQYGGIWNRGAPVPIEGPIFTEPGLYNLFVEVHTVGTTRTQVEPVLQYDVWVTPGREEVIKVPDGSKTLDVTVRNYYGTIEDSSYDAKTKTIRFSMPFDWASPMVDKIGMLHTEIFIPKALSDFDKESLRGTVNGIESPVFVDNFGEKETIVHFTISQAHLFELRDQIKAGNLTPDRAAFTLSPPEAEARVSQTTLESKSFKVILTTPEKLFSSSPTPVGVRISDKAGKPVQAATYEIVIAGKDNKEAYRAGGVTTPEGISSQDVMLKEPGPYTVRVDKINASSESVQVGINVEAAKPALPSSSSSSTTAAAGPSDAKVTAKISASKGTSIKIVNGKSGKAISKVTFEFDTDKLGSSIKPPKGWKVDAKGKVVTFTTAADGSDTSSSGGKPVKAGKAAIFIIPTAVKSFKWTTFDGSGKQLQAGTLKI